LQELSFLRENNRVGISREHQPNTHPGLLKLEASCHASKNNNKALPLHWQCSSVGNVTYEGALNELRERKYG
jgi:hypothetical protein